MNLKKALIASGAVLAVAGGVVLAIIQPTKATSDNGITIINTSLDSAKSLLHKRSFGNKMISKSEDSLIEATKAFYAFGSKKLNYTDTVVIVPSPVQTNPGGKVSQPISYNNVNGKKITGFSFDGGKGQVNFITLNNCSNDTITLCRFSNTAANSITLYNCKNIIIRYNFFTMVNFGVHAEACQGTKVEYNQGLNLYGPTKYNNNFAHWVQYHNCNSGGQSISYNKFESDPGIAVHPHDAISIDASSGIAKDSIMIIGNQLYGGQITAYPSSGDTGGGIMAPDESGNFYVVRGNIMINPGCAGIQSVGSGSGIVLDGNLIYNNVANPVSAQGLTILGSHSNMVVKNMRVWWLNKSKQAINRSDGQTGRWYGGSTTIPGVTQTNNNWLDVSLNTSIIKQPFITYK